MNNFVWQFQPRSQEKSMQKDTVKINQKKPTKTEDLTHDNWRYG